MTLLEQVRDYIALHPEEHDQQTWAQRTSCGTTRCVAGTAVFLHGDEILWHSDELGIWSAYCKSADGASHHIQMRAGELLGVSGTEAFRLFTMDNSDTLKELDRLIEYYS